MIHRNYSYIYIQPEVACHKQMFIIVRIKVHYFEFLFNVHDLECTMHEYIERDFGFLMQE